MAKKEKWLGRTLGVGLAGALALAGINYACTNIEAARLERQVYKIANTDNNNYFDWNESSQLGLDLGLIRKNEKATPEYIESALSKKKVSERIEMFQKYIDSHKNN